MQGTRLPDAEMGVPGGGWDQWEGWKDGYRIVAAPPGSYMRVLSDGKYWCWYITSPTGNVCSMEDNHQITEHEDGTITASPSIVFPHGDHWHGWLERGIWRSA